MARWKLTEPHYLNVPSERWELTTNDVRTGKPVRKMFRVPKHLDPRLEDDWNVRINGMDGEIHVCLEGKGNPGDIVFEGNPTPGMLPLDDEAREISGKFDWTPTQDITEEAQRTSFYAKLGDNLINQLTDMRAQAAMLPQASGLDKFMEAITAMMAQNQQILAALVGKIAPAPVEDELTRQARELGETKLGDFEDDLDSAEPTEEELAAAAAEASAKEAAEQKRVTDRLGSRRI
jgi:hypothetical protein